MNTKTNPEAAWRTLLVDDERPARKRLTTLLAAHPAIQVVGEARDLVSARELVCSLQPNLVFLDVQLSLGNGFDLLKDIPEQTKVIFVTAHDKFAVRAFETNALDYLLKPILPERLAESIKRLEQFPSPSPLKEQSRRLEPQDSLILRDGKVWRRVEITSIAAVLGEGTYTRLLIADGSSILTLKTMGHWLKVLPEQEFMKLSRSVIVNLAVIQRSHFIDRNHAELWLDGHEQPLVLGRVAIRQLRQKWTGTNTV